MNYAQIQEPDSALLDSLPIEDHSYFMFDVSFMNNSLVNRTDQQVNSSATLTDISFYHKSGLVATIMPIFYHTANEPTYDFDTYIGYQYFFENGFDINGYYCYHYFSGDSLFMGIEYSHSFNASIGYYFKGLYLSINGSALLGESTNFFGNGLIGYMHEFPIGKSGFNFISIFPSVSVVYGTHDWVIEDYTPIEKLRAARNLRLNGYTWGESDFQNFNVLLPLTYTYKTLSASVSYMVNIPFDKYKVLGWENQTGVLFSLNYILNLN